MLFKLLPYLVYFFFFNYFWAFSIFPTHTIPLLPHTIEVLFLLIYLFIYLFLFHNFYYYYFFGGSCVMLLKLWLQPCCGIFNICDMLLLHCPAFVVMCLIQLNAHPCIHILIFAGILYIVNMISGKVTIVQILHIWSKLVTDVTNTIM